MDFFQTIMSTCAVPSSTTEVMWECNLSLKWHLPKSCSCPSRATSDQAKYFPSAKQTQWSGELPNFNCTPPSGQRIEGLQSKRHCAWTFSRHWLGRSPKTSAAICHLRCHHTSRAQLTNICDVQVELMKMNGKEFKQRTGWTFLLSSWKCDYHRI